MGKKKIHTPLADKNHVELPQAKGPNIMALIIYWHSFMSQVPQKCDKGERSNHKSPRSPETLLNAMLGWPIKHKLGCWAV